MNIVYFDKLNSTNSYAKENIDSLKNFDVIVANIQSAGYGQWGRKWLDVGVDNVYLTIVLKPKELKNYTYIVRYTAVCLCLVFEKFGVLPKIKEPNDIIVNNKKISGILAESITKGDFLKGIIIGVGVNLNTSKFLLNKIDQPATSLNIETGKTIDKENFINDFLNVFETQYQNFTNKLFNLDSFL